MRQLKRHLTTGSSGTGLFSGYRKVWGALWLLVFLLPPSVPAGISDNAEELLTIDAVSTGQATGHIADLYISNFSGKNVDFHMRPCFIPSENKFQSYLTVTDTVLHLKDSTEVRLQLKGYCADIFTDPVPVDTRLPLFSDWLEIDKENGGQNFRPSSSRHWIKDAESRLFFPGSKKHLGFSLDMHLYPAEVSWLLWITVENLEKAYRHALSRNAVNTPYSGDREKEKWAVIQHSFWIFTSELNGKYYPRDFFESKIMQQYHQHTSSTFPESDRINNGISQFWYTFHFLLNESGVLDIFKVNTRYVKVQDAEILIIQEKQVKH